MSEHFVFDHFPFSQSDSLCKECFFYCFETEIHETIVNGELFKPGDTVAVGASGGKGKHCL